MNLAIISFTKAGSTLNAKVASLLENKHNCTKYYKGRCEENVEINEINISLNEWCQTIFTSVDGIIFIGACGIAVRTIAPFIEDKTKDPLVIVMDEKGEFVISLLSGHIGRGNELTNTISYLLKATPVITTATDVNHKFAVDVFASKENLHICDMKMAKEISASILDGKKIGVVSTMPLEGKIPESLEVTDFEKIETNIEGTDYGKIVSDIESVNFNKIVTDIESTDYDKIETDIGICISVNEEEKPFKQTLSLIPKIITIGVGCKKNTDIDKFENYVWNTLKKNHISIHSIKNIASIDLKLDEPCINAFSDKYDLDFITYTADKLNELTGDFQESEFVKSITGVGNVCERSAIMGCNNGTIILEKQSQEGMTIALAKETRGIHFE